MSERNKPLSNEEIYALKNQIKELEVLLTRDYIHTPNKEHIAEIIKILKKRIRKDDTGSAKKNTTD